MDSGSWSFQNLLGDHQTILNRKKLEQHLKNIEVHMSVQRLAEHDHISLQIQINISEWFKISLHIITWNSEYLINSKAWHQTSITPCFILIFVESSIWCTSTQWEWRLNVCSPQSWLPLAFSTTWVVFEEALHSVLSQWELQLVQRDH